jgi:acetate kinase
MSLTAKNVLTINGGSSSIKFSLFQTDTPLKKYLSGRIERIGLSGATLTYTDSSNNQKHMVSIEAGDHVAATIALITWLEPHLRNGQLAAIGHRVVHGMSHSKPELVTHALLDELHQISAYDPDHLPLEIKLIEVFQQHFPRLPQVACFDTAFHHTLPRVAKILPIPHRFDALGIQRYGFHGLSYQYLMQELERLAGRDAAQGRVILAHLGNGASMAAVNKGQSMDTSMGFTPTGGLVMGTRTGDLDPGVAWYLMQSEKLTPAQFNHLINHESGLLGVSGLSSDMHDLTAKSATDNRAAEAVELFCYQAKKWIGAYAAALGGLDTLVFSGGIGENAADIRAKISTGLGFLGIDIDTELNAGHAGVISKSKGQVIVRVIHTDEEIMIAKSVIQLLALPTST